MDRNYFSQKVYCLLKRNVLLLYSTFMSISIKLTNIFERLQGYTILYLITSYMDVVLVICTEYYIPPRLGRLEQRFFYAHGFHGEFGQSRAGIAYLCFTMSGTSVGRTWELGVLLGGGFTCVCEAFTCKSHAWGGRTWLGLLSAARLHKAWLPHSKEQLDFSYYIFECQTRIIQWTRQKTFIRKMSLTYKSLIYVKESPFITQP